MSLSERRVKRHSSWLDHIINVIAVIGDIEIFTEYHNSATQNMVIMAIPSNDLFFTGPRGDKYRNWESAIRNFYSNLTLLWFTGACSVFSNSFLFYFAKVLFLNWLEVKNTDTSPQIIWETLIS